MGINVAVIAGSVGIGMVAALVLRYSLAEQYPANRKIPISYPQVTNGSWAKIVRVAALAKIKSPMAPASEDRDATSPVLAIHEVPKPTRWKGFSDRITLMT
jgi:hypothetical protein